MFPDQTFGVDMNWFQVISNFGKGDQADYTTELFTKEHLQNGILKDCILKELVE